VDERWIINALWGLLVAVGLGFAGWIMKSINDLWRAIHHQDEALETRLAAATQATNGAIDALHRKTNAIRQEIASAQLDGERHHASKEDLAKAERVLGDRIKDLTVAIADLRNDLNRREQR
jgi:prefoldin subunit 5